MVIMYITISRFRVKVDPIKMEKFDSGVNTKYMDYIDVPASSKKDFKLSFYAYKESFTTMKVSSRFCISINILCFVSCQNSQSPCALSNIKP